MAMDLGPGSNPWIWVLFVDLGPKILDPLDPDRILIRLRLTDLNSGFKNFQIRTRESLRSVFIK